MKNVVSVVWDVDGVVGDWITPWLYRYNKKYNLFGTENELKMEMITSGNLKKFEVPGTDVASCMFTKELLYEVIPNKYAQVLIKKIHDTYGEKVKQYFCTAIPAKMVPYRACWLEMHFPQVTSYHFAEDKSLIHCDILIDDAVHNHAVINADLKILPSRVFNSEVSPKWDFCIMDIDRVGTKDTPEKEIFEEIEEMIIEHIESKLAAYGG